MTKQTPENVDAAAFESETIGSCVVIKLKRNGLSHASDIAEKMELIQFIEKLSAAKEIRSVLLYGNPHKRGTEEYLEWQDSLRKDPHSFRTLSRLINGFHQFIQAIVASPKLFIYADQGNVTLPYISLGLASDYVFMANDAVVQNPCPRTGTLSVGGISYFLSRNLSRGKILEWTLFRENISTQEAVQLGLVDKMVNAERLMPEALAFAQRLDNFSPRYLASLKKVLNANMAGFNEALAMETREIHKTFETSM